MEAVKDDLAVGLGHAAVAGGPAPLVLVAAYDPDGPEVYLTFDREIDVSGVVVGAFVVFDGPDGNQMQGFESPGLLAPNEAWVLMHRIGAAGGDTVVLTAGAGNGIVAVDDGGTWEGTDGLVLPFPSTNEQG